MTGAPPLLQATSVAAEATRSRSMRFRILFAFREAACESSQSRHRAGQPGTQQQLVHAGTDEGLVGTTIMPAIFFHGGAQINVLPEDGGSIG